VYHAISYPGLVIYRILLWLALPVVLLRLWWRGRRDATYRPRWQERFGFYSESLAQGTVWFHTVSAGETIAAAPTIRAMTAEQGPVLVTTMTPTGSERVASLLGDTVAHCYAPYDFTFAVRRFLTRANPRVLVLMETEIWPNLILEAKARGIPVILVNARLSEKSARGYQRFRWLSRRVLECFDLIACQTPEHAQRFIDLGVDAKRVQTVGNVKYDLDLPTDVEARAAEWAQSPRRYWIAASTHPGEEELVLHAHFAALESDPSLTLLLAPRHPNRAAELAILLDRATQAMPITWCRYGDWVAQAGPATSHCRIVLIDEMGVLMPLFRLSEVAFVGGSLVPRGGHNPIEPASLGTPVITGPHDFNFAQVYADLMAARACQQVNEASLTSVLVALLNDAEARKAMGAAASEVVASNKGAQQRTQDVITQVLSGQSLDGLTKR
jgi:3-deoxy-D-manno-octulosonic-acid transferase